MGQEMTAMAEAMRSEILKLRLVHLPALRATHQSSSALFAEAVKLKNPLLEHAWLEFDEQAQRCLGAGYAAFRKLQANARAVTKIDELERSLAEGFQAGLGVIAKGKKPLAFVTALREKLEESDPKARFDKLLLDFQNKASLILPAKPIERIHAALTKGVQRIDLEGSMEKLAKGKTKNISLLKPFVPDADSCLVNSLERNLEVVILCLCRGLMAAVHAQFNLAFQAMAGDMGSSMLADDTSPIEDLIGDIEDLLIGGQKNIFGTILSAKPPTEIANAALALAGDIECALPIFARTQAALRLAGLELRRQGKGARSERHGELGVAAFRLTREAIASHATSYRLAAAVFGPDPPSDVKTILKMRSFSADLPRGKNTELDKLSDSPDGTFVEIKGFVNKVATLRQSDGKLISRVSLVDPSSKSTAEAAVVFAHLPHAGVTRDAFCKVSGIFKAHSNLLDGGSGVEVDILSLSELGKESFNIAFLGLADKWFQPWRNGANFYWSMGPHAVGDDGLLGAGELLFSPFIRR